MLRGWRASALRFRLFGFPVRIDLTFGLIGLVIWFGSDVDSTVIATWLGIVAGSVLVHELGHAVAARRLGAEPTIALYALGGLTSFQPPRPLTRAEAIGVSLAGPMAGALAGAGVGVLALVMGVPDQGLARFAILAAIWVNLGWGMVNLVPVLPLDGGQILMQMLPGSDEARTRRAGQVSFVVGVGAVVAMALLDLWFGAALFAVLVALNAMQLTQDRSDREHEQTWDVVVEVEREAVVGDPGRARRLLSELGGKADPTLYALVTVCESGGRLGVPELEETARRSGTPAAARWLTLGLVRAGRSDEIASQLSGATKPAMAAAQHAAHTSGAYEAAIAIGRLALGRFGSESSMHYNVACSLARLGRADEALAELWRAVAAGFGDPDLLDQDLDLALLRTRPEFDALRARVVEVGAAGA